MTAWLVQALLNICTSASHLPPSRYPHAPSNKKCYWIFVLAMHHLDTSWYFPIRIKACFYFMITPLLVINPPPPQWPAIIGEIKCAPFCRQLYIIYHQIRSGRDAAILQEDINKLCQWENDWQMDFNTSKCFVMNVIQNDLLSYVTEDGWCSLRTC